MNARDSKREVLKTLLQSSQQWSMQRKACKLPLFPFSLALGASRTGSPLARERRRTAEGRACDPAGSLPLHTQCCTFHAGPAARLQCPPTSLHVQCVDPQRLAPTGEPERTGAPRRGRPLARRGPVASSVHSPLGCP